MPPIEAGRSRYFRIAAYAGVAAIAFGAVVASGGLRTLTSTSAMRRMCDEQYAAARTARDSAAVDSLTFQGSRGLAPRFTCGTTRATASTRAIRTVASPAVAAPAP